jgi:hypothetical protein
LRMVGPSFMAQKTPQKREKFINAGSAVDGFLLS